MNECLVLLTRSLLWRVHCRVFARMWRVHRVTTSPCDDFTVTSSVHFCDELTCNPHTNREGAKNSKGARLSWLHQRQNMKGNDSTVQGKTKLYTNIKINHATQKNIKRQTQGPTGLYELFLLTVPIEEVARCVLIIFPLNLQTSP